MARFLPAVFAVALLLLSGIAHGLWTDRWGVAGARRAAAERLSRLPLTIGNWDGTEVTIDPRQRARANVAGFLGRHYVQRQSGQGISVFLVSGRPGPVSVHTPEFCLPGSGFQMVGSKDRQTLTYGDPSREAVFFTADFAREAATTTGLQRVYWAWCVEGDWQAVDNPRVGLGRYSNLYKLYIMHRVSGPGDLPEEEACRAFLRVLLPELQHSLFDTP
jgi:hypothetical protein